MIMSSKSEKFRETENFSISLLLSSKSSFRFVCLCFVWPLVTHSTLRFLPSLFPLNRNQNS